tara:strand:- start:144 stop:383 length:240 start_codon:yes stop_codon:yes gene_type:complete
MKKQNDQKWIHYHATRLNLIDSLNSHIKSIEAVNVYHNETNQCDSHSMMNEDMGLDIIQKLIKKITRDGDQKQEYKDAV